MQSKILKNEGSVVEIEVELTPEEVELHKNGAIKKLGADVELPGFRKGKATASMLEDKIPSDALMHEMAERAVSANFALAFKEHKIMPLGRPNVTITKIAKGNPLVFKIETTVMPDVELPDYKAIAKENAAKKEEPEKATDKELTEAIKNIREYHKQDMSKEMTNEDAKKIGEFKDVADFKSKIEEQVNGRKEAMAREKKRVVLVEEIIKQTKVSVPEILVEGELGKMTARFKADVERAGMKLEDYFKQIGKDEEQLKKEWRPDAEKQAKLQLILNKIASVEHIVPDEKRVEDEVKHLLQHQPDADAKLAKIYISTILMNEKVFEFLEKQGD